MRYLWLLLFCFVAAGAFAADGDIFPAEPPGGNNVLEAPADMPDSDDESGWFEWVAGLIDFMWAAIVEVWEFFIQRPAAWLRRTLMGWFCWIALGGLNFLADLVDMDHWKEHVDVASVGYAYDKISAAGKFMAHVIPFTLWASMWAGVMLIQGVVGLAKWIIALIPGT
jgi:hypothetical protein